MRSEDAISFSVIFSSIVMYGTIDFDHERSSMTVKINDETFDDLLAAEMEAMEGRGSGG